MVRVNKYEQKKYFSVHYKKKKPGLDQSSEDLTTRHA